VKQLNATILITLEIIMTILPRLLIVFFILTLPFVHASEELSAVVIGSGSPKFNTERSGPSVLISYQNHYFLLDMGNGTQAQLNKIGVKIKQLDGLFFTHHHLDHNEEFAPILIRSLLANKEVTILGPKQTQSFYEGLITLYNDDINYRLAKSQRTLESAKMKIHLENLEGGESLNLYGVNITVAKVNHTIDALSYRFDAGGRSIVVSGDLTYSKALSQLAKNADYLLMDSGGTIKSSGKKQRKGQLKTSEGSAKKKISAHVNLDESSRMAVEAKVKTLILTHFTQGIIDEEKTKNVIAKHYSGTVLFAKDFMRIPVETTISKKGVSMTQERLAPLPRRVMFMDKDKDRRISQEEAKNRIKKRFNLLDKNQDGYVIESELR